MALRLKIPKILPSKVAGDADFTDRFMAWWNGEEVDARSPQDGRVPVSEIDDVLDAASQHVHQKTWSSERARITQMLWGAGFNIPGGADYLPALILGMTPSAADTLLTIGSGLGGVETVTSKKFGAYIASYNADPELCRISNAIAARQGVDEKVTIRPYEGPSACIRPGYHTGVILLEHLFRESDRDDFLLQIANGMKTDAVLVGTDLVTSGEAEGAPIDRWKEAEIGDVFPCSHSDLKAALTAAGFRLRTFDLDTAEYVGRVVRALSHMLKELHRLKQVSGEFDEALARALVEETELWGSRVDAMRARALHHVKFVALR